MATFCGFANNYITRRRIMTQLIEKPLFNLEVGGETCLAAELYSAAAIDEGIRQMGETLVADYSNSGVESILVVPLLQGALNYTVDLCKVMRSAGALQIEIGSMRVKSYEQTESTGELNVLDDLKKDPKGRHVLVVDDIYDTGLTLSGVHSLLSKRGPATFRVTTLLDKPSEKRIQGISERVGGIASVFTMEKPYFVIGRGMDYEERYRQLPYIARVLHPLPDGGFEQ